MYISKSVLYRKIDRKVDSQHALYISVGDIIISLFLVTIGHDIICEDFYHLCDHE